MTLGAKIIPRILGGLGNQLFCYAAARRLALVNDAELVIDDISGFEHDYRYQRQYQLDRFTIPCRKATSIERMEPFSRVRRYMKRNLNRCLPFEKRKYIRQERIDLDLRLLSVKPRGTVYLEGYWQSEEYFKDVESTIRNDLHIIPPLDQVNLAVAEHIRNCLSISIHVRFFDMQQERSVNNAPNDYYAVAISRMEELVPGAHYFVFSDQPSEVRARIPLPDERITLITHNQGDENAYADLWLMTQCRHHIIANSTFSWWGAWLCNNEDKVVIAPGFCSREGVTWWGFEGLIPERWIRC